MISWTVLDPRRHKARGLSKRPPRWKDREFTRPSPLVDFLDRSRAARPQGTAQTLSSWTEQSREFSRPAIHADIIGNKKPHYHKARAASKRSTTEQSREFSRLKRSIQETAQ